jgi:hypothetical protein
MNDVIIQAFFRRPFAPRIHPRAPPSVVLKILSPSALPASVNYTEAAESAGVDASMRLAVEPPPSPQ